MSDRARAKAPKAVRTSDVVRPRTLALAALGAAVGVGVALALDGMPMASARPIARPHAKVACASCHGEASTPTAPPPASACKTCHGAGHASTRPAHRRLAASGELACTTCHRQHAGAQGVTFQGDAVVRWAAGAEITAPPSQRGGVVPRAIASGTTVPLVSLAVCTKCHDTSRAADPISACVPRTASASGAGDAGAIARTPSQCFDEHVRLGDVAAPTSGVACAAQHGPARFIAWDAARDVAATTPWVAPAKRDRVPWTPAFGALVGALVLGAAHAAVDRRRRRAEQTPKAAGPAVPAARKRLPTIDTSTCLGCYACVDACPFDVLVVEKYVAVVARPEECCGVVLCEQVCPNGSLRVTEGEPILDRPATDDELESKDVPGLFLAGDLTGLPLIKNAINQGARAIDRIAATMPRRRGAPIDVIVIGAGPAGLSAALRAKEKGLSCVVVEQATVAASIKSFPRDKIVHDPPLDLPVEGELWLKQATKEELLAQWTRIVRARALDVREGRRVVDIRKESGDAFSVTVEIDGDTSILRATRVVLAIGRRGTPRQLDLEIEPGSEDRIAYALADARTFEGKRVVVAGLGDSAMEAALAIARQPGTTVTITYRGHRFGRGKAKNIEEIQCLVADRKVKLHFETSPVAVTRTGVVLAGTGAHGGKRTVGADALLVLVGGVPSWDLLTRAGIRRPDRGRKVDGVVDVSGISPGDPSGV